MTRRTADYFERLTLRNAYMRELIQESIRRRWGATDWEILYPWWREPSEVRILMYADGDVRFVDGLFGGMQHVKTLLESGVYFYVNFNVTTAHRDGDPSASIPGPVQLTELDILENFDEIWFFGIDPRPNLTQGELTLLDEFMAAPKFGGVLVTGDHANLGKGIAGQITRAGEIRRYPAPGNQPRESNTTVEEGPDENDTFNDSDQSDDRPQTIRYARFPVGAPIMFKQLLRPHPVLCGPDGPIDVFPDHRHEGEALAPTPATDDPKWPTKNGHQERPDVIAFGLIKEPDAINHGKEIGLVSVYNGHNVDVGRIIADSSWHHWFDINLLGILNPPSPYAGFDATPEGRVALKKIDAYFLNCGAWLAPPVKQAEMRNTAWWSILWTDQIAELSTDAPIWYLGEQAIDALGRLASSCAVTEWVLNSPVFEEQMPRREWPQIFEQFPLVNMPIEQYVAGGIISQLMQQIGPSNPELRFPSEAPPDELLSRIIDEGAEKGLSVLTTQLKDETSRLMRVIDNNFRLEALTE